MKKILLLSVFLLITGIMVYSAQPAMLFLNVPVGAAAAGLGGAYTARATGVQALYWNPAGINIIDKNNEIMFFHNNYVEDLKHTYLAYLRSIPQIYGTIGISVNMFDYGSFNRTTLTAIPGGYQTEGIFSSKDFAFGLSYKPETVYPVKFGLNVNYLKSKIDNEDAAGLAIDLGWRYESKFSDMPYRVALTAKNIGTTIKYVFQKEQLPLTFKTGFTFDYFLSEFFIFSPVIDLVRDQSIKENYLMFGIELSYDNMFSVRAGYDGMSDAANDISFGCGVKGKDFGFNYAFKDYGRLSTTHLFELLYKF